MVALGLIPVWAWLAVAGWLYFSARVRTMREGLLAGALLAAAWLVVVTEGLSRFQAIRFWPVLLAWALPAGVFAILAVRAWRRGTVKPRRPARMNLLQLSLAAVVVFCAGWSFLQAAFSAPSTPDSLAYHMQREVMWMQHGSVAFYPTSVLRQLVMPPMAEFAGLHLMVLTGSDIANNLEQWIAYLLTMVAVSLIVRRFSTSATAQWVAMVWVAANPTAFIQASNTKNDVILALWCVTAVYFVFELWGEFAWRRVIWVGLAMGAAVLTKGTGLIFGLPIGLTLTVILLRRYGARGAAGVAVVLALVVAMNGTHWWRNVAAFGTIAPDGPAVNADWVTMRHVTPRGTISGMLRNIGPQLVLPWPAFNAALTEGMIRAHAWLGVGVNEPETTYAYGKFERYAFLQNSEDLVAAPGQMYLLLLLPAVLAWGWRRMPRRPALLLVGMVAVDFVLFSVLLKWQIWHVRLVIPMFMLLGPVVAWAWTSVRGWWVPAVGSGVLVAFLVPTLNGAGRPLVGPESIFRESRDATAFASFPTLRKPDQMIVQALVRARPGVVGFQTGWSSVNYLIERMLLERMHPAPRFVAFNAAYQSPGKKEEDPDIVIAQQQGKTLVHESTGTEYVAVAEEGPYTVYVNPNRMRLNSAAAATTERKAR